MVLQPQWLEIQTISEGEISISRSHSLSFLKMFRKKIGMSKPFKFEVYYVHYGLLWFTMVYHGFWGVNPMVYSIQKKRFTPIQAPTLGRNRPDAQANASRS